MPAMGTECLRERRKGIFILHFDALLSIMKSKNKTERRG